MLSPLFRQIRKRRNKRSGGQTSTEPLERRELLAGEVAATIRGGDLVLTGDRGANQVEVSVIEGDVVVTGLDGTTVNGQSEFIAFAGSETIPNDLRARLGDGSDQILITGGLVVGRSVDADLGSGANMFAMSDASADRVTVRAKGANQVLVNGGSQISGDLSIRFRGDGSDTIVIDDAEVGDDLSIKAGHGANSIMIDGVAVADDVAVTTGRHRDDVMVKDSSIDDDVKVRTNSGEDFVVIEDSNVGDGTSLSLGKDDDAAVLLGANTLQRGIRAGGSSGTDALEVSDETDLNGRNRSSRLEHTEADDDLEDERLNGTDGLNARRELAEDTLNELLIDGVLAFAITPTSFSEGGSAATATITTDKTLTRDLTVELSVSESGAVDVPDSVVIPAGQDSVSFDVTPIDNDGVNSTQSVTITASANRHEDATASVDVTDDDILTLTISETTVPESAGSQAATATVTRESATDEDLVVNLASSDDTAATVPTTVTIPAGQASVTFDIAAVDDSAEDDSTQTATITATADGHADSSVSLDVTNDDVLSLTISSSTVSEADGAQAATGTISREVVTDSDLVVTLSSSDETAATVPATVTIPAGQSSVTFDIAAVDDIAEGDIDQIATVTASTTGFPDVSESITVSNDETLEVSVDDDRFFEGTTDVITGTVTRGGATTEDLVVTLNSDATTGVTVPDTVTILAGESSADFVVTPVDDTVQEADEQNVTITATAQGHPDASVIVAVRDDEFIEVTIDAEAISENGGAAAAEGRVRRESATDTDLVVTLVNGDSSEISIPTTVTIPAGSRRVFFDVDAVDDAFSDGTVTVQVTAIAPNHRESSTSIDVTDDNGLSLTTSLTEASEGFGDEAAVGTVTREGDLTEPVTVNLSSSDTSELTVVDTLTILAGEASATFAINPVDDTEVDLTQEVTITVSADEFADTTVIFDVLDDDATIVGEVEDEEIGEDAGSITLTLTRNSDNTDPLTVNLSSSSDSDIIIPATAEFAAGEDTVSVVVTVNDNSETQGNRDVTIIASSELHQDGGVTLSIIDDEAQLSLTVADDLVAEGFGEGGTTGTVTRNTPTDEDLVVTLRSGNLVEIAVPDTVTIPAGQTSVSFDVDVQDDSEEDLDQLVTIVATAPGHAADEADITVNDNDSHAIRFLSSDRAVASSDVFVTRDENLVIEGLTLPNAVLNIDTNGDDVFDDDTVTADNRGFFTYTTALDAGENDVDFSAADADAEASMIVHLAEGTVVRFDSSVGFFDIELLDEDAPITVANFLNYLDRYTDSIIHRSPADFVIQGGGFVLDDGSPVPIATDPPIQNEATLDNLNVRGTLSMALPADPNGGTSQWFVNVVDNPHLDGVDRHTVFGRVLGSGLAVADAINSLDVFNIANATGQGALQETPLVNHDDFPQLTGTVSGSGGLAQLAGTGTSFTSELQVGDIIRIGGGALTNVVSIESDTQLVVGSILAADITDATVEVQNTDPPNPDSYVRFNSIAELLDDV